MMIGQDCVNALMPIDVDNGRKTSEALQEDLMIPGARTYEQLWLRRRHASNCETPGCRSQLSGRMPKHC